MCITELVMPKADLIAANMISKLTDSFHSKMNLADNFYGNEYYSFHKYENSCPSGAIIYFKSFRDATRATAVCPAPAKEMVKIYDPITMLRHVWHILCTILPAVLWFALARMITQKYSRTIGVDSLWRFTIEFIVIVVPTVVSINVINEGVEYIVAIMAIFFAYVIWRTKCLQKAAERNFIIGTRPRTLTLARATISFLTAYCILAIDFESFPTHFRKTRRYGVGLMDTGIGLFVFAMGTVSKRPKIKRDFKRMLQTVVPLLLLGIIRTVVILTIDYRQDEHEYGKHLNAFFTLGFTKLFGTLVSCFARKESHLLPLGVVVLTIHEICLQLTVADFVMYDDIERNSFLNANREGLCSLPGFVGVYIVSMYLGYIWQTAQVLLTFKEFINKMKHMSIVSFGIWLFVILSIFTVSIARVTCNFGYAAWTLGIASFMTLLFMIVFDLVLNTLYPIAEKQSVSQLDSCEGASLLDSSSAISSKFAIPSIIEAVNMNGLVFFLVANVLTGVVNIFLSPESRTNFEGYFILSVYMLIAIGVVYALYRRNIRIG